jgi:hypothetical protein
MAVTTRNIRAESRVSDTVETVIERRHQNGRWPLNLLHPEPIPLEMEPAVGSASRWNTLRALESCVGTTTQRGSCDLRLDAQRLGSESCAVNLQFGADDGQLFPNPVR